MPKTMYDTLKLIHAQLLKAARGQPIHVNMLSGIIKRVAGADPRTVEKYRKMLRNEKLIQLDGKTGRIQINREWID